MNAHLTATDAIETIRAAIAALGQSRRERDFGASLQAAIVLVEADCLTRAGVHLLSRLRENNTDIDDTILARLREAQEAIARLGAAARAARYAAAH